MDKNLYGKDVASKINSNIKQISKEKELKMAIIQIGNDKASTSYRKFKKRQAKKLNVDIVEYVYDRNESQKEIIDNIENLNKDKNIHGIFIEQPIPKKYDSEKIIEKIYFEKDIDGITSINAGNLYLNKTGLFPATAEAIIKILDHYDIKIKGKRVVIIGRSNIVGKPVAMMVMHRHGTITVCHSRTKKLKKISKEAEILIAGVGKAKMIDSNYISDNTVVLDAGYNVVKGKTYGDVDYDDVFEKAKYITPVPGGVGSVTTAIIFNNLLKAYKLQNEK